MIKLANLVVLDMTIAALLQITKESDFNTVSHLKVISSPFGKPSEQ